MGDPRGAVDTGSGLKGTQLTHLGVSCRLSRFHLPRDSQPLRGQGPHQGPCSGQPVLALSLQVCCSGFWAGLLVGGGVCREGVLKEGE